MNDNKLLQTMEVIVTTNVIYMTNIINIIMQITKKLGFLNRGLRVFGFSNYVLSQHPAEASGISPFSRYFRYFCKSVFMTSIFTVF